MQIKTEQFAEAAREALHDTYTRTFLDGMHEKIKERLKSMESFPDPAAARKLGAAINIPVEEICDVFLAKKIIDRPTRDPVELGYAARRFLRDKLQGLEMKS